jgi:hypothetical protein
MTLQPAAADALPSAGIARYVADYHALSGLMAVAVHTDFVPAHFRPRAFLPKDVNPERATPDQWTRATDTAVASATIGARFGVGLGLGGTDNDPFVALSNVYVVSGKPSLYAESMVALVLDRGHDVWTEDLTDARAIVCGRRKGSEHVERVTITMEQARRAGWTRNAKYRDEPQAMLYARAAARVCRRVAADALKGFGQAAEELEDDQVTASPAANGTRTVQRSGAAAAAVEAPQASAPPPLPDEVDDPQPAPQPIDERQWRQINARFVELGVTGPGQTNDRLRVISDVVGHEIKRGSQLTAAEAQLVLDNVTDDVIAGVLSWGPPISPQGTDQQPYDRGGLTSGGQVATTETPQRVDGPPLPGEQDPPADPWGINNPTGDADEDEQLDVPGDES